jgi:hypothetical protein
MSRRNRSRTSSASLPADASLIDAWWAAVLAGDIYQPHPLYTGLKVRLGGRHLRLSGELESDEDRTELIRQARKRIGRGIDRVDVSQLTVATRTEKPGILEQSLISAFPSRDAAEYARDFVIKLSRVVPKQSDIVDADHADELRRLVPEEFLRTARRAIDSGDALMILRVDETEAFRVRELLEEETRSQWTIGLPPRLKDAAKR